MDGTIEVPWIRAGIGHGPEDGGCIMQVVDWVSRREWTDDPPCVHPVLRTLAVGANDRASDEERQRLLDWAPRFIGTNEITWDESPQLILAAVRGWLIESGWMERWRKPHVYKRIVSVGEAVRAYARFAEDPSDRRARDAVLHVTVDVGTSDTGLEIVLGLRNSVSARDRRSASVPKIGDLSAAGRTPVGVATIGEVLDVADRLLGRDRHDRIDWTPVCDVLREHGRDDAIHVVA